MTGQRNSLSAFNHRIQLVSNRHRLFIRPLPTSLQEKDAFNMSTNSASPKETQTAPKSSSAKPSPRLCMSCGVRPMRYTCPKCNSIFCSKECYQSHSSQCSETFYRENIEADLKAKRPTLDEQRSVKAILEREKLAQASDASTVESLAHDGASSGNLVDEEELLELATLDLNDPNWMAQLSSERLEKFHRILASGALDEAIHPWIPWWYRDTLSPKITLISQDTPEEEDSEDDESSMEPSLSPPILDPIPSLASLTKIKPSPLLANNVLEVLYAYAYTKRLYNGDWEEENGPEAVEMVISLSEVLRENAVYKDLKDACRRPLEMSLRNSESLVSGAFSISVLDDVRRIVSHGPQFVMAALSELHGHFLEATRDESQDRAKANSKSAGKGPTLSQMQKKLLFFLVWTNECSKDVLPSVELGIKTVLSEYDQPSENLSTPTSNEDSKWVIPNSSPNTLPQAKEPLKKGPKIVEIS